MRIRRIVRGLVFVPVVVLLVAVLTWVVMRLWNWLMPPVFGLHLITYWQALGILVLSKILLGRGFRPAPGRHWRWRRRMMERWAQMTPEEREKFRQEMSHRCGPFGTPAGGEAR
jgi:hypothetical protein